MSALIFAVVFGFIAKMPSQGVPYFLIAFAGMMGWTLFNGNLTRVTPSLIANGPLIRKIYFPRLLAPLAVVPSVLLDFFVSLGVMVVLLIVYRVMPDWGLLLFPFCVLIILMLSLGLGLIGASLSVKYRDIQHIVPFVTQLMMYASPVGYSVAAVPAWIRPYYSAQSARRADRYHPLVDTGRGTAGLPVSRLCLRGVPGDHVAGPHRLQKL